jgi:plasmid stabilization system protein ParE
MKRARFLDVAEFDLIEAFDWYEQQQPGFGRVFNAAVRETVSRLMVDPESHSELTSGIRRRRVLRFPFDVLFGVTDDEVVVIAVMHHHRSPDSWAGRWPEG